jgi:hypothetical protein
LNHFTIQKNTFFGHIFDHEIEEYVLSRTSSCKENRNKVNIKEVQGIRNAEVKIRINEHGE